ncbi:MAG: hypothetical protein M3542_01170 [Acidobacteriota bacterium]|nr:hypothetical protein [Acidobacteriota bacterium]MDQ5873229.1 hypothetical protein [Acidobacteriota bacterium]
MKPRFSVIASFTLSMVLATFSLLAAQEEAAKPETVAAPEALSARSVESIEMSRTKTWTPSDPAKKTGALVVIRLPAGGFATEEFALAYKAGQKTVKGKKVDVMGKAVSRGYSTGGGWAVTDEEGKGFKLFTGNPVTDIDFLFEIPKTVSEVTLLYKGKPAGKPVAVRAGENKPN